MKTEKYHIYLSTKERNEIVASLINLKNKLIEQGRYTHYVVVGEKINQIARIANAKSVIDVPHLKKEIDKLDEFIIDMKNKYLRPDKDK